MSVLRCFIGYDEGERIAYHSCVESLIQHSTEPLSITPLSLGNLTGYWEKHTDGSNAFTYSRFLVPYLCGWNGWALYLDGDMILKDNVVKLFELRNEYMAAMVVKHDYKTQHPIKYRGAPNQDYPCKNWSSVILWNCGSWVNRCLTPERISMEKGAFLHRFMWVAHNKVGSLPLEWNWLVGEYEKNDQAKLLHYTLGIPVFKGYEDCDHAEDWNKVSKEVVSHEEHTQQRRVA